MPDGAIYWFGYGYNDTDAKTAGWANTASYIYCVENTRSIEMKFTSVQCFIGTKNAGKASNGTFKAIAYGTGTPYAGWYGTLFLTNAKIVQDSSVWDPEGDNYMRITGTTRALYSKTYKGGSGYRYISGYTDVATESAVIEALWIE